MSYTKYGEFVRILRIKNDEVMGDLAPILGASLPFMSAVENGKKNVPEDWIPLLIAHYNLNDAQVKELHNAVEESKTQMKINLTNSTQTKRTVAIKFVDSFDYMDDETAKKLMAILDFLTTNKEKH